MSDRLRVAVIGTGSWGEQHARIFAGRDDVELVGVLGRNPDRARARAAAYQTTAFTDLDQLIGQTQPELVTVSLPNEQHFEPTLRLIDAGVNLLVEKPLVFDLEQADTLLEHAERTGIFFAINFNHRYAEPVLRARSAIEAGDLGKLIFLSWRFGGEGGHDGSPDANLIETQCHGFDLLEHLGGPISSVSAQMTTAGEVHSTVAIALRFASGAVGTLLGSYDTSYAYPDSHLVEVNGNAGRLTIHDTVQRFTLSTAGDETRQVWEPGYFNDEGRSFHATFDRHVDRVLEAVRHGAPPPVHARAGRRALLLAQACIASFASGRSIDIEAFDADRRTRG